MPHRRRSTLRGTAGTLAILVMEELGKAIALHERVQMAYATEGERFVDQRLRELWGLHGRKLEVVHDFLVFPRPRAFFFPNALHHPLSAQIRHAVRSAIACPASRASSASSRCPNSGSSRCASNSAFARSTRPGRPVSRGRVTRAGRTPDAHATLISVTAISVTTESGCFS